MRDEKNFLNNIWNDYDMYLQDRNDPKYKFFKKHVYKNTDYTLRLKTFSLFIITILFMATGVYGTITTYNNREEIKQFFTSLSQQWGEEEYYDWSSDMEYDDENVKYKIITNYKEYSKIKSAWKGIVDMNEEDFKENFVIILVSPNRTYISNVYSEGQTTIIEISRNDIDENIPEENCIISTKISNNLNKENIDIKVNPNLSEMKNYIPLAEITTDYSKEMAIEDGCFVIEYGYIVSNDKNQMDKFLENVNNNINSTIRIVRFFKSYGEEILFITDIVYKDGKCEVSGYDVTNKKTTYMDIGDKIVKLEQENTGIYSYFLVDSKEWEKYGTSKSSLFSIYKK